MFVGGPEEARAEGRRGELHASGATTLIYRGFWGNSLKDCHIRTRDEGVFIGKTSQRDELCRLGRQDVLGKCF